MAAKLSREDVFSARGMSAGPNDVRARGGSDQPATYVIESAEGVTTFPGDTGSDAVERHAARFLVEELQRIAGEGLGDAEVPEPPPAHA